MYLWLIGLESPVQARATSFLGPGCPVPNLLQPRDLTWEKLKADTILLNSSLSNSSPGK